MALAQSSSGTRLIGQAVIGATNLAIALLVAWAFGPAVFGVYSFFALVSLLLVLALTAAFVETAASIVAPMAEQQRLSHFSALLLSYGVLVALSLVPLHFALIAIQDAFLKIARVDSYLVTAFVVIQVSAGLLRAFLQAFAGSAFLLSNDIARSILILSALAATVLAPVFGYDFDPYATVIALQTVALGAYIMLVAIYSFVKGEGSSPDFSALAEHRARSGLAALVAAVRFLQTNAPLFLAQLLLGEQVFGVLRTCQTIANFAALPLNALRLNNFAQSAITFASGGTQLLVAHVLRFVVKLALMAFACGLLVLAVLFTVPHGLRPSDEALIFITVFLLCTVVSTINPGLDAYFYAKGDLKPVLIRSLAGLAFAILCAPLAIHFLGALGAPISLFAVLAFVCVTTILLIFREVRNAQTA
jgi:O-antigen/teichoic acid export membrane protein